MNSSEAPARPAQHRAGGGFRNPPGSPREQASWREMLKFLLVDIRVDRQPTPPAGHVAPRPPDLGALPENHVAWLGHAAGSGRSD